MRWHRQRQRISEDKDFVAYLTVKLENLNKIMNLEMENVLDNRTPTK